MDQNQLEKRILVLEKWKSDRERQQIVYPLDTQSQIILGKYLMQITGTIQTVAGAAGHIFMTYIGQQGDLKFQVNPNNYILYTVNTTTDFITASDGNFPNDTRVNIATSDTPPSPLDVSTDYFVVNSTSNGRVFQLSLTQGGAAINITTTGTGLQYIYYSLF